MLTTQIHQAVPASDTHPDACGSALQEDACTPPVQTPPTAPLAHEHPSLPAGVPSASPLLPDPMSPLSPPPPGDASDSVGLPLAPY